MSRESNSIIYTEFRHSFKSNTDDVWEGEEGEKEREKKKVVTPNKPQFYDIMDQNEIKIWDYKTNKINIYGIIII